MPVQWDRFEPGRYEEMVSVLLSRLYADSLRMDGKGGDGGRDVQIVDRQDGSMVEAFEEKSFTGRMTPARRRQVERSLRTASALKPRQWTLVVPIDPTPSEYVWFRKLGEQYQFPLVWRGKTWLDEKMASFPDVERYYVDGASDEVIRLVTQLRDEQAWIGDVNDVVQRLVALHERLDEIDPHYRYELATVRPGANFWPSDVVMSVRHGDVRIDVYPKYFGAGKDRPITLNFTLALEPDGVMVQESLGYGLAVDIPARLITNLNIDAPSGLGGDLTGGELKLWPVDTDLEEAVTIWLDIMKGDERIASCLVRLTEQTGGPNGTTFTGTDSTGWFKISFRVDFVDQDVEGRFRLDPESAMPVAVVPLLRWLDGFQPGRRLRVRWPGGVEFYSELAEAIIEDGVALAVFEALAFMQERRGVFWEVSPLFTDDDVEAVLKYAALVRGETVMRKWKSFKLNLKQLGPEFDELIRGGTAQFMAVQDVSLGLDGQVIPIGRIRTHIPSARLADVEAVRQELAGGSVPSLRLVPGDSDESYQLLVSEPG